MPNGNSPIQGSVVTYTPAESLPVQNMTSPSLEGATLATEEVQLVPIEENVLTHETIDFSRISSTPENVLAGIFLPQEQIQLEAWNGVLTYQVLENGVISIFSNGNFLGFTDTLGISKPAEVPIEVLEDTYVEILDAPTTANTEAYTIDTSFETNPPSDTAPTFGRHDTSGNTTYQMSEEELRKVVYVVNHESNGTYEDALGVISVILNRIEDGRFNASTPLEVVTAPKQFEVWNDGKANTFTLEQANPNVLQAVQDATLGGKRNNDYVEFKASYSGDYTKNGELKHQLVEGGNKYHHLAKHLNRYDVATPDATPIQTTEAL